MNATHAAVGLSELLHLMERGHPLTHYQVLGVPEAESLPSVIELAYRNRVAEIQHRRAALQQATVTRLLRVCSEAKVVLTDADRKAHYDRERSAIAMQVSRPPARITVGELRAGENRAAKHGTTRTAILAGSIAGSGLILLMILVVAWQSMASGPSGVASLEPAGSAGDGSTPRPPPAPPPPPPPPADIALAGPAPTGPQPPTSPSTQSPSTSAPQLPPAVPQAGLSPAVGPTAATTNSEDPIGLAQAFSPDGSVPAPDSVLARKIIARSLPPVSTTKNEISLFSLDPNWKSPFTLRMDTSAAALPANQVLGLELLKDAEVPTWRVLVQAVNNPPTGQPSAFATLNASPQLIAQFRIAAGELRFEWNAAAPEEIAGQLANCLLDLSSPQDAIRLALRNPVHTGAIALDLSDSPQQLPLELGAIPRKDRLILLVNAGEGFPESVDSFPTSGSVACNKQLRLVPQASWKAEFQFELLPRTRDLAVFHRPYFRSAADLRQDFTFERLKSAVVTTQGKLRRDSERLAFLQARQAVIPGQISQVSSSGLPPATRTSTLAKLYDEARSVQSGIERLNRTLPLTKAAVDDLAAYQKLAETLHIKAYVHMRIVAIADTGEIPIWIAGARGNTDP